MQLINLLCFENQERNPVSQPARKSKIMSKLMLRQIEQKDSTVTYSRRGRRRDVRSNSRAQPKLVLSLHWYLNVKTVMVRIWLNCGYVVAKTGEPDDVTCFIPLIDELLFY